MKIEKSLVILRSILVIEIVKEPLSDACQQSTIVSRKISSALEGAIGPVEGVPQDLAVFEPGPSILRSDGKQRLDRLRSALRQLADNESS